MTARNLWIAANLLNILSLAVILWVFRRRRERALLPIPAGFRPPASVLAQRKLNVQSLTADMIFYGLLLLLGVAMLAGGIWWPMFADIPVPGIIPGGTLFFAIIYLGKAITRLWESARREDVQEIAMGEAWRRRRLHNDGEEEEHGRDKDHPRLAQ